MNRYKNEDSRFDMRKVRAQIDVFEKLLNQAAQNAKCEVVGLDALTDPDEMLVIAALLNAFGDDPNGFIYPQPGIENMYETIFPDVILCFENIGLICLYILPYLIENITKVEDGHISFKNFDGKEMESIEKVISTSTAVIQNRAEKVLSKKKIFSDYRIVLPFIFSQEWVDKGFSTRASKNAYWFYDNLFNTDTIKNDLEYSNKMQIEFRKNYSESEQLLKIKYIFDGDETLREKFRSREKKKPGTLGNTIYELLCSDKRLSDKQRELGSKNFEWTPRVIRGVAGSGKTKILALNLAKYMARRYHEQFETNNFNPRRVAAICYNQALVPQIRNDFIIEYFRLTGEKFPSSLFIGYTNKLLFSLSNHPKNFSHGPIKYVSLKPLIESINNKSSELKHLKQADQIQTDEFVQNDPRVTEIAAQKYLEQLDLIPPSELERVKFDSIYVDEAQDLSINEIILLTRLCKLHGPKQEPNIIFLYDNAQNIYGVKQPNWSEDFGLNVVGRRTQILDECFRNTKEVIEFSYNVLLGACAPAEQRTQTRKFADLNTMKTRTNVDGVNLVIEEKDYFRVNFAPNSNHDVLPDVKAFSQDTRDDEALWVADEILRLVGDEEVDCRDILVIVPTWEIGDTVEKAIKEKNNEYIAVYRPEKLPWEKKSASPVFLNNFITVTTPHTAKGHEAFVVFVTAADSYGNDTKGRASFYVACTRARLKLYVSGRATQWHTLFSECQKCINLLKHKWNESRGVK